MQCGEPNSVYLVYPIRPPVRPNFIQSVSCWLAGRQAGWLAGWPSQLPSQVIERAKAIQNQIKAIKYEIKMKKTPNTHIHIPLVEQIWKDDLAESSSSFVVGDKTKRKKETKKSQNKVQVEESFNEWTNSRRRRCLKHNFLLLLNRSMRTMMMSGILNSV